MKSNPKSIRFKYIFTLLALFTLLGIESKVFSQGFNENEWIFGSCDTGASNYLSFGKGGSPTVQSLPNTVLLGKNNSAIAIDPITGQPLFQTNGELVYDFSQAPIEGSAPGLNGNVDSAQQVATGFLEYDPNGNKLFYIFYISLGGELQYSLVDMNAPGQATGNERPLGEVISKDISMGNASGALLVVKSSSSPSYLISFNGGNLVSQRLDAGEGNFTTTDTQSLPFMPERIIFNEETGKLILIPADSSDPITVMDFNTGSGTFSNPTPISNITGSGNYGGADFSPDGSYIYYSLGNQLFRVPADNLSAAPEEIPLTAGLEAVYDVKVGPDGSLYYIYEETAGGPQLIGRVTNPDEPDLSLFTLEEDPFMGADFCGRIFPVFAPNADINPSVDFTWDPEMPCANNPVQLNSTVTPENYSPASYSWEFSPPLTDSDGNPIDADYTQQHFLIPADAAQGTDITVTLTVTYEDGETQTSTKTIPLTENNLEANFTPSDTTLCMTCIDIGPLLMAQAAGQDGEAPDTGGGSNYEYFWSNYRDEGWGTRQENEVCLPGLYWALVREPGSSCYAYAEIRIKIWDMDDQSNNIWYFGDGAGLDFNPDPDDPDAPTPRPIANRHPQNIPAGTTTISDQTGQVLFFTDGATVWDLNGNVMENGDSIGGDNTSSQSVLAVPVPDEQTLFYLFTTQQSSNGTNEVSYSLVDIKAENQTGVGNVVTKNNFLFSPSTEHTAAFNAGDTTWMMFHELGNNTFRAYPVSSLGIGQPVLSSVGSNHGFNSGVGAMKFNSDGDKVAVTISEGGCNKLEIFNFDQDTGEMTEYARIDLGCDGDVYGLEFSEDGDKVLVSFRNGGPGIQEFNIKPVDNDDPDAAVCPSCFDGASTRAEIEACINSTKKTVSQTSGLDLGALQIGPNGQIYVAVVGDNRIGQINVGTGCNSSSTFTLDGVEPMPGTSNLGLPSFVQNSGSSIPEPALSGPPRICLDPDLGGGALFEGAGEPDIDSYFYTITDENGVVVLDNFGGPGDQFQTYEHIFTEPGLYTVDLRVDRCGDPTYYEASMEVRVDAPPVLTLVDDVTLCSGAPVTLTAIDGYDPAEGIYDFQWTNAAGQVFGDENSNEITVEEESIYTVTVSYRLPEGLSEEEALLYETCPSTAEVFVGPAFEFDLTQTSTEVCYEETTVVFAPNTPISGEWFYTLDGDPNRTSLGVFFELELFINTLPGPGQYEIIFVTQDPILEGCTVEKKLDLIVNELPIFTAVQTTPATDCNSADGSFEITMQGTAQTLTVLETGETFSNISAGNTVSVSNLLPGVYTIEAENSFGCLYTGTVTIENSNPPAGFEYTVSTQDEVCSPLGVENGVLIIDFTTSPQSGSYTVTRQGDGQVFTGTFTNTSQVLINVPYGEYAVEIQDPTNCAIPDPDIYTINQKFQVVFSVPSDFTACESFTFTPDSPETLNYTVTNISGGTVAPNDDGSFTITQSGTYTVLAEDPTGEDCPKELEMIANITQPIDFEVSEPIIDCQVGVRYEAILNNALPEDVIFLWKDEGGIIVGRSQTFTPSRSGNYTLEVQPIAGGLCPVDKKPFEAVVLTESLEVALDVVPFCADQTSTTITVVADLSNVAEIEWYSVQGNTRTRIPAFDNLPIIEVSQEGTYEVLLRSAAGCDLGRANGVVAKSVIIPPVIPTSITICALEGVTESIDPGDYDNYSWQLNGEEISQDAIFTPTLPGIYTLVVSDNLGCEYIATMEVIEDCALKISFPNGVVLDDPTRNFILYANEYIDYVEVYIYNRWGELIFYCNHENVEPAQAFCPWDGQLNGKFVPNGTYAVVVKLTSEDQNITQKITKAITVIQ
ncbi:T9SS type B sorting domain-containing protein [Algoriphagus pacificus]|uniref:Gliding motility-associated C-terminal domain-containing protein n=1 Tax=Algoriphagus pacificus TaxID=2811234 RepID=A0ABS3CKW0_9BACT|nr:gliding motility-associated C-terminal domain-containing protein [Algoriphagus pacificus]MBN7817748.1 gliding motility-associated C-terminal domain-containing protein [Algoriphagus pacificus]